MTPKDRWNGARWAEARFALQWRSGGKCEKCGKPLRDRAVAHHRLMLSHGGADDMDNLLWVHPDCHWAIHAHPAESYAKGWLVHMEQDPKEVPWSRP